MSPLFTVQVITIKCPLTLFTLSTQLIFAVNNKENYQTTFLNEEMLILRRTFSKKTYSENLNYPVRQTKPCEWPRGPRPN